MQYQLYQWLKIYRNYNIKITIYHILLLHTSITFIFYNPGIIWTAIIRRNKKSTCFHNFNIIYILIIIRLSV